MAGEFESVFESLVIIVFVVRGVKDCGEEVLEMSRIHTSTTHIIFIVFTTFFITYISMMCGSSWKKVFCVCVCSGGPVIRKIRYTSRYIIFLWFVFFALALIPFECETETKSHQSQWWYISHRLLVTCRIHPEWQKFETQNGGNSTAGGPKCFFVVWAHTYHQLFKCIQCWWDIQPHFGTFFRVEWKLQQIQFDRQTGVKIWRNEEG